MVQIRSLKGGGMVVPLSDKDSSSEWARALGRQRQFGLAWTGGSAKAPVVELRMVPELRTYQLLF